MNLSGGPDRQRRAGPLAAVAWAVGFALLHVHWALGGRFALVDVAGADAAFGRPWFRLYNLSVVVGCLVVAAAALALVTAQRALVERIAKLIVAGAGLLLLVRGVLGAGQLLVVVATSRAQVTLLAWGVDLYMLAGGALLVVVVLRSRQAQLG